MGKERDGEYLATCPSPPHPDIYLFHCLPPNLFLTILVPAITLLCSGRWWPDHCPAHLAATDCTGSFVALVGGIGVWDNVAPLLVEARYFLLVHVSCDSSTFTSGKRSLDWAAHTLLSQSFQLLFF